MAGPFPTHAPLQAIHPAYKFVHFKAVLHPWQSLGTVIDFYIEAAGFKYMAIIMAVNG